ncbi:hypothetical protein EVAR_43150_1 [Eumeta japonica]|uniref:Uncharacterized protein n=1 Tax=Eumeta variegata TaxID=151549 RepID=A0A4C1XMS7_EUMVA|nr:hypothetical protein EVAR_43150_1 [Eumeta japonica]
MVYACAPAPPPWLSGDVCATRTDTWNEAIAFALCLSHPSSLILIYQRWVYMGRYKGGPMAALIPRRRRIRTRAINTRDATGPSQRRIRAGPTVPHSQLRKRHSFHIIYWCAPPAARCAAHAAHVCDRPPPRPAAPARGRGDHAVGYWRGAYSLRRIKKMCPINAKEIGCV